MYDPVFPRVNQDIERCIFAMSLSLYKFLENSCHTPSGLRHLDEYRRPSSTVSRKERKNLFGAACGVQQEVYYLAVRANSIRALKLCLLIHTIPSKVLGRWYLTGEVPFILQDMIKLVFLPH